MTNLQLLVLAVMVVGSATWWSIRRASAAWAPTVLAIIFLAISLCGPVWEWSKWAGGAGLPPNVGALPFDLSPAVPAFLWAAIGAGLSAFLISGTDTRRLTMDWSPPKHLGKTLVVVSAVAWVGFLAGSGPSILSREVYLQSDGNFLFLRIFWPTGIIIALTMVVLTIFERDRKLRLIMIVICVLWYVGALAVGSRTAVAFPLLGAMLILANEIMRRRLHVPMVSAAAVLIITSIFTFSVSLESRYMTHGLLNIPHVAATTLSNTLNSADSLLFPVKQLASSVAVSMPDAEQAAVYDVDLDILVANANIMPGTAQPMELERYWPYEWVPLSFAGTWYAATGWIGQTLLFAVIGWMLGYTFLNFQRSRFRIVAYVPIFVSVLIGLLAVQYSSRMVWRVVSIGLVLCIASYLVRERQARRPRATAKLPSPRTGSASHA